MKSGLLLTTDEDHVTVISLLVRMGLRIIFQLNFFVPEGKCVLHPVKHETHAENTRYIKHNKIHET